MKGRIQEYLEEAEGVVRYASYEADIDDCYEIDKLRVGSTISADFDSDAIMVKIVKNNFMCVELQSLTVPERRQAAKEAILLCHRLKKALEDIMAQPFSEAEFAMIAFQEGE